MGRDKATLTVGGETLARRTARLLAHVCRPVLEVGPGSSGLDHIVEDPVGSGPLVALAAGWSSLSTYSDADRPSRERALVVSCDLPLLEAGALALLADWPGTASVVPLLDGRPQPLCARWSAVDLGVIEALVGSGERSLQPLLARPGIEFVDAAMWCPPFNRLVFADADTPEDLERLTGGT